MSGANESPIPSNDEDSIKKGKLAYLSYCSTCHNINPKNDGTLGPAIFGSSRELLEARIMRAEYPNGYQPKRETKAMVALPHLEKEIEGIFKFLNTETH